MNFIKSLAIEPKSLWDLIRYKKYQRDLWGDFDDNALRDKAFHKFLDEAYDESNDNRDYVWKMLRGYNCIESVHYSLQGMNNRIVPVSMKLKNGEIYELANFDRHGTFLDYDYSKTISYKIAGGSPWEWYSWITLTDEQIKELPGYAEFARDLREKDGRRHLTWDNVSHVIWDNFIDDSYFVPREVFLKDGTRLTKFSDANNSGLICLEDDGDRYVLYMNTRSSFNFPCYKEVLKRIQNGNIDPYDISYNLKIRPIAPRIFTFEYMEKRNYLPDVVRKTKEGKYIVSCSLSDLTEKSRKNAISKGVKSDSAGRILLSLSHDVIAGEAARHIEIAIIKGKVDREMLNIRYSEDESNALYNEIVACGASTAKEDAFCLGRTPNEFFLEEGWHDRLTEYRNSVPDPFSEDFFEIPAKQYTAEELLAEINGEDPITT